ncbi:hypothetical protein [Bacillus mycoides]|uniref:hypothetical protein n=1 Tax=Bacillus mycoides TaxID=1405 RepID=UPI003A812F9C
MYTVIGNCLVKLFPDLEPTEERIKALADRLPQDVKTLAAEWGWDNKDIRYKVFVWVRENAEEVEGQLQVATTEPMVLNEDYLRKRATAMKEHVAENEQSSYYQLGAVTVLEELANLLRDGKLIIKQ